jgi:hypothetical protein
MVEALSHGAAFRRPSRSLLQKKKPCARLINILNLLTFDPKT